MLRIAKARGPIGFARLAGRLTRSGLKPLAAPLLSHAKFAILWATALHDVAIDFRLF
jgi:hypothetical protein